MTAESLPPVAPSRVFAAILLRDLTVARRELPYFLVRTALQPILFVIVFGFLLPKMGMIPRGYSTTMLPGVVALSLTLSAIQSVALPMMQDFGFTKEIEDRLLSPVPIHLVAVEKVVAGVLQGIVAALFVLPVARLIMGPIPGLSFANAPLLLAVTVLGGAAFSARGQTNAPAAASKMTTTNHGSIWRDLIDGCRFATGVFAAGTAFAGSIANSF